ncbi:hypothetical protein [Fimbriiglobus ruber]|uniref:Uncharacterized protein n=1 Tax=Fimbriiglobus ruber TaxID=1908690 RepID=A0A225DN72_9BACT|nr:hypothetical protein [Fimbriiglobus ruber]OWK41144.1 hypothetical protein FRUB_05036 [Fimbriiglobus ruber]
MGGLGSGKRFGRRTKPLADDCWDIDTVYFGRRGLLKPGTHQSGDLTRTYTSLLGQERSSTIEYTIDLRDPDRAYVELRYRLVLADTSFTYPVRLVSTGCAFGGVRWWFLCPLVRDGVPCRRRVRVLYLRGGYYGCRACHRLSYASTQNSDRRVSAYRRAGGNAETYAETARGGSLAELSFSLKLLEGEIHRL